MGAGACLGFAGADYDLQDALVESTDKKTTTRDADGQQFYDYELYGPVRLPVQGHGTAPHHAWAWCTLGLHDQAVESAQKPIVQAVFSSINSSVFRSLWVHMGRPRSWVRARRSTTTWRR